MPHVPIPSIGTIELLILCNGQFAADFPISEKNCELHEIDNYANSARHMYYL